MSIFISLFLYVLVCFVNLFYELLTFEGIMICCGLGATSSLVTLANHSKPVTGTSSLSQTNTGTRSNDKCNGEWRCNDVPAYNDHTTLVQQKQLLQELVINHDC